MYAMPSLWLLFAMQTKERYGKVMRPTSGATRNSINICNPEQVKMFSDKPEKSKPKNSANHTARKVMLLK
jgi:hypothetical protein